jgi:hypothetical protein
VQVEIYLWPSVRQMYVPEFRTRYPKEQRVGTSKMEVILRTGYIKTCK